MILVMSINKFERFFRVAAGLMNLAESTNDHA